ncbi:hypothetical protein HDV04_000830 [Boothiomyces sp. JEL0838]|nr:hypothetical protein HDV04_001822 [Boothiomyces sp. JEL0838]KAJ3308734.1 hypothetical protein HDV04_000830 [Boothiomyces sp. JEL0838]
MQFKFVLVASAVLAAPQYYGNDMPKAVPTTTTTTPCETTVAPTTTPCVQTTDAPKVAPTTTPCDQDLPKVVPTPTPCVETTAAPVVATPAAYATPAAQDAAVATTTAAYGQAPVIASAHTAGLSLAAFAVALLAL